MIGQVGDGVILVTFHGMRRNSPRNCIPCCKTPIAAQSQTDAHAQPISIPAVLARFGVVRLLALLLGLIPYVPPDEKAYYSRFVRTQNAQALTDESPGMPAAGVEAAAVKTFGDLPLIVLTAGLNNIPGWQEWQTELLQLSSNSLQVQIEEPDAAVAAIIQMVEQVRQTVKK